MDRHRAPLTRALGGVAALLPAAFLALFFAYPLGAILARGLGQDGSFELPLDVLGDRETLEIAWFTLWQAAVSTVLTLVAGLPLAWATARVAYRGRSLVRALVVVPFVLPTIVVATAFVALLPDGYERGVLPILAAHVFFNVAVVVRLVGGYWARLDPRLWDAAATLGASPARRVQEVTLPALGPALAAAASLVFLFSFTSFGVVVVLGGPGRATLEAEIYYAAARAFDLRTAAILALLQLAAVAVLVAAAGVLERRAGTALPLATERTAVRRPRGGERALLPLVLGAGALLLGAPLVALAIRSVSTPDGLGLDSYRALREQTPALLVPPWEAIGWSLAFASAGMLIAVGLGTWIAAAVVRRDANWLDVLAMLPLGASAVMLGFGFLIAFDDPPLDLRRSWWLVPIAQSLVATPFVVRALVPALRAIDNRLRDAAAVLGAPPGRVWREIDLPLAARALAAAAGLAFAVCLGEFGATVFLARAERPTLPVAIFRFLGRPGAENQGIAAALCVVLMVVAALAVLVVERAATRRSAP
jgi:thiamine transport system permease protein